MRALTRRSALPPGSSWLALLLAAGLALLAWAAANRPATPPDYAGRIAGFAFSPFQRGQSPETGSMPDDESIRRDLALVAGQAGRVRTYTVVGTLGDVPALAAPLPLRVTLGAWLTGRPGADDAELDRLVAAAAGRSNVERVLVGNETILRGDLTADRLIADIARVRRQVRVPVSTAEPWHVWLKHPELAASVDYLTVHLLPYWEGLSADDALRFVLEKLASVQAAYPGKPIVIGEIGWPSDGVAIGAARAGRLEQAAFMRRFFRLAEQRGLDYFAMEAFDQPWKTSFEGRAAGYWGLMDLDRAMKWPLTGPVRETPFWGAWAGASVLAAALLAGLLLHRRPDASFAGKLLFALLVQGFTAMLACVLLTMSGKYLSGVAVGAWGTLAAAQAMLLLLLLADSFELMETLFVRGRRRVAVIAPAPRGVKLPKVSLHLPICNEPPRMVRRTLDALALLDYPDFEVLVIDNNTTDPALWEPVAEHCARLGPRFRFFHLGNIKGFKAGALNFALSAMARDATIVGVLDSDYVVQPDWLRCMVPQFDDGSVGFVQSPQDYADRDQSIFKRLMFWEYAGFFQLGMITRNERNAIIQHGTMTLIRAAALRGVDGWAEWCICEDAELGLKLFRRGWQAVYAPRSFGRGVMPDDFCAYRRQRFRWACGAMQIIRAHAGGLLNPFDRSLTLGQRWHFVTGWLPWVGDALGLLFLLLGLVWSVGLVAAPMRFEFPVVLFMLPSVGVFVFKLARTLALYRARVACGLADRIGAAVAGLALSHTVAKAVWRGLLGGQARFRRTPKLVDAPALLRGLVMAREEAVLLVLTWAAMAGVGYAHRLATWEARLWCAVLLTQSLPYVAAVALAVLAAVPARRPVRSKLAASRIRLTQEMAGD